MKLNQIMPNLLILSKAAEIANCYIKFWTCRTFTNITEGIIINIKQLKRVLITSYFNGFSIKFKQTNQKFIA